MDSCFTFVHTSTVLIDIVDKEWAREKLPADNIVTGVTLPSLDADEAPLIPGRRRDENVPNPVFGAGAPPPSRPLPLDSDMDTYVTKFAVMSGCEAKHMQEANRRCQHTALLTILSAGVFLHAAGANWRLPITLEECRCRPTLHSCTVSRQADPMLTLVSAPALRGEPRERGQVPTARPPEQ